MIKHHIDLTLTEEQTTAMEGWLDLLQASMSMLVSVSGPDSRRLFKMGAKSEAFVRNTLEAATQHEALLPSGIREHMERDAALRERLRPLLHKLQQLLALAEGSYKLAGADLMKNSTAVYQILRLNGYQEGLEPLLEELGTRFARPKRKKVEEGEEAPAAAAKAESSISQPAGATATPAKSQHIAAPLHSRAGVDAVFAAQTQHPLGVLGTRAGQQRGSERSTARIDARGTHEQLASDESTGDHQADRRGRLVS